jgi:hypothetical protein
MAKKWDVPGRAAVAQAQIRAAVEFLLEGKIGFERAQVVDEIVAEVRGLGRGSRSAVQADALTDRDEYERDSWSRGAAHHIVNSAMRAVEPLPKENQISLLREIAKLCLWHIPESHDEARKLKDWP